MPNNKEFLHRLCPILHKGIYYIDNSLKERKNSFQPVLIKLIILSRSIVSVNVQSSVKIKFKFI